MQQIINDSLSELAPVRKIQISQKNTNKLTESTRQKMVDRDQAFLDYKRTKSIDDLRYYRNLKNTVNRMIGKEKFERKKAVFHSPGTTIGDKWKIMKRETGQGQFKSPQILTENGKCHTAPHKIAQSLNRQFIQRIRKLVDEMENCSTDPLVNYRKVIPSDLSTFTFQQVTMAQLRKTLHTMRSTNSTGEDDISVRSIKQAQNELEPLLFKLVNSIIKTKNFPQALKTTKVVPIAKGGKDPTSHEGWRPINLVVSLSKVVERTLLQQILQHTTSNNIIGQQHHGSVKDKGTQTLITELQDLIVENLHNGKDGALIVLDQSKAYDLVSHPLLLKKLELLGFQPQALQIMSSFLQGRKQYVQLDGFKSDKLDVGPTSVVQGSTLSCMLYLLFILDLPELFHSTQHQPAQYRECSQVNLKTFVDDGFLLTQKHHDKTLKETIENTMGIVENYTKANRLSLNADKTKIMLLTKDTDYKDNFEIHLAGKPIRHSKEILILGNLVSENMTWNSHVTKKPDTSSQK